MDVQDCPLQSGCTDPGSHHFWSPWSSAWHKSTKKIVFYLIVWTCKGHFLTSIYLFTSILLPGLQPKYLAWYVNQLWFWAFCCQHGITNTTHKGKDRKPEDLAHRGLYSEINKVVSLLSLPMCTAQLRCLSLAFKAIFYFLPRAHKLCFIWATCLVLSLSQGVHISIFLATS